MKKIINNATQFPLISLLCLLILAVGTLASISKEGEEAAKEIGSHVLRETCHKIWEFLQSDELWDNVQDMVEEAKDLVIDGAQIVLENM